MRELKPNCYRSEIPWCVFKPGADYQRQHPFFSEHKQDPSCQKLKKMKTTNLQIERGAPTTLTLRKTKGLGLPPATPYVPRKTEVVGTGNLRRTKKQLLTLRAFLRQNHIKNPRKQKEKREPPRPPNLLGTRKLKQLAKTLALYSPLGKSRSQRIEINGVKRPQHCIRNI